MAKDKSEKTISMTVTGGFFEASIMPGFSDPKKDVTKITYEGKTIWRRIPIKSI